MRERFKGPDWWKLVRLPVVVYHAVASADGRVDAKEAEQFHDYLLQSRPVDPLLRAAFEELLEQGREALNPGPAEQDFTTCLAEVRQLLEARLSADERRSFLAGLLGLGHRVAAASGGFFGLGNRISAAESTRLEEVSAALGLDRLLEG